MMSSQGYITHYSHSRPGIVIPLDKTSSGHVKDNIIRIVTFYKDISQR